MKDSKTIPLQGSLVCCPRCLTENDKSDLITRAVRQFAGQKGKKAFVLANCLGCGFDLPLLVPSEGRVEAVDVDPYHDVQEATKVDLPSAIPASQSNAEADLSYERGAIAFVDKNYAEAYKQWKLAYEWYSKLPSELTRSAALLSNMGMALSGLQMPSKALGCFEAALENMDRVKNSSDYATVLNNMGAAYLHLGDVEKAEEYHRKGYELHLNHGGESGVDHRHNLAFTYGKIASREKRAGNLDKAIGHARRAVALYDASNPADGRIYFAMLGSLLLKKAESAKNSNRLDEALRLYGEVTEIHARGSVDRRLLSVAYDQLARLQRRLGLLEESLVSMQRAEELEKLPEEGTSCDAQETESPRPG